MQLILNMNNCVGGESASPDGELIADPGYQWMCGACIKNPKFDNIHDFFTHKLNSHAKIKKDEDLIVYDNNGENNVTDNSSRGYEESDLLNINDSNQDVLISEEEDNLPLARLRETLKAIKIKVKTKELKKTNNVFTEETCAVKIPQETDQSIENSNSVQDFSQVENDNEIIESNENDCDDFSWESPAKVNDYYDNSCDVEREVKKDSKYVCKICHEEFSCRGSLSKHKTIHMCPETGEYKCETCGKLCPKYDNFTRHLAIHLENRQKSFRCEHCFSAFYNMADLKRHAVLHMDVKPYLCDQCEEGFTRQDALFIHLAKHTGVPYMKYSCKLCGKVLNSPSALAMHSKNHTNKSVFCPEPGCQFSCYLKSQLKQHVRTHSGEKPFQCAQCGRCFARSNDMKNHVLNVHQRYRPHKCPDCPKEFTLPSSLKAHQQAHLDVRPYLCAECGKRFNHPSTLRKHTQFLHEVGVVGKRNLRSPRRKTDSKMYADVGVQSNLPIVSSVMSSLVPSVSVSGIPVPVTIHIPHITVSLEHGFTQAYVIPNATVRSPQLIKHDDT